MKVTHLETKGWKQKIERLKSLAKSLSEATIVQIGAVGASYSMGVSLFLLMRLLFGEQFRLISFLNHVMSWLLLGTVFAALLSTVTTYRRVWLWYTLPSFVAFIISYGALFLPSLPSLPFSNNDTDAIVTVATYNSKLLLDQGTPENIAKRWQVIENLNADIIAFQEVENDLFVEQSIQYPYKYYQGTLGLISRYPLHVDTVETFGLRFSPEQPSIVRIETTIKEQRVAVYFGHLVRPHLGLRPLNFSTELRTTAVNLLAERLAQEELPHVFLCDCNMTSTTEDYKKVANYLNDGWYQKGFGLGFTAPADPNDLPIPVIRSDYIWYANLQLQTISILKDPGGSDHYPLIATFGLP